MRVRLRIERNQLPAVNILWAINDTDLKQTVAQFLERVNDRFPLEGESWGLEDYAVTIGGYEALHYNEVGVCFQNEDEVVIQPLQYVDVRARTITGRNQISEDGRHLVDGVPWGRPLLKRARRPDITIPPRKRQKWNLNEEGPLDPNAVLDSHIEEDEDEDEDEEEDKSYHDPDEQSDDEVVATMWDSSDGEDGDESEDEEYDPDQNSHEEHAVQLSKSKRRRHPPDKQQAVADEEALDTNDTASSSSDDTDSSEEDSSSDEDSDDNSETSSDSSDSSSDASEESWKGISQTAPATPSRHPTNPESGQEESAAQTESPPEKLSSRGIPFEGSEKTRNRNARRREQRRLKFLKQAGTLPATASLADMYPWQEENEVPKKIDLQRQTMENRRHILLNQIAAGGVDVTADSELADGSLREDGERPLGQKAIGDIELPTVNASTETAVDHAEQSQPHSTSPLLAPVRARLDPAGTSRLIFGSLGVRAPKTQAEKDALQKKLATRPKRGVSTVLPEQAACTEEADEDPDAWRDKIELSAVECCDEGVTLSEPPFPFKQRWDRQYHYSKKKKSQRRKDKSFGAGAYGDFIETYDKYNVNGGSDALNYDDAEESEFDDSYWEDGALLQDEAESDSDGFPALPADIATLPSVVETDARQGDIIVFEELACSAATGWQPQTTTRTVRLESSDGDGWHVKLATRDLRPRQFDDEGNRVYSKFEMEGLSDDEDEEDEKTLLWDAMTNPRLLQRSA